MTKKGPGRPKSFGNHRQLFNKCKRDGCNKKPQSGQAYCSREHSPFGRYGLNEKQCNDSDQKKLNVKGNG